MAIESKQHELNEIKKQMNKPSQAKQNMKSLTVARAYHTPGVATPRSHLRKPRNLKLYFDTLSLNHQGIRYIRTDGNISQFGACAHIL